MPLSLHLLYTTFPLTFPYLFIFLLTFHAIHNAPHLPFVAGCDSSLADRKGQAVNEEVYEDKGKLVFDNKYRTADLPGLWVASK